MQAIPKGATVRQVAKPIEGVIEADEGQAATRFNETTGSLEYHVGFKDAEGEKHFRWFPADELEEVKQDLAAPAPAKATTTEVQGKKGAKA